MEKKARPTIFSIAANWDAEAGVWTGSCDSIPVAAEARTLDGLLVRVAEMTADVLGENHPHLDRGSVYFQITALRELEPYPAAA